MSRLYDVFISHAIEDKIPLANELCSKLEKAGINVSYVGNEVLYGAIFKDAIDKGLKECSFGIILFTPHYLSKFPPSYSLNSTVPDEPYNIIPVLHQITANELHDSPFLLKNNFFTTDDGISQVADVILYKMGREPKKEKKSPGRAFLMDLFIVTVGLGVAIFLILYFYFI